MKTNLLLLLAAAAASSSAEFLDKDYYLKNIAPKALSRVENFRTERANNFTASQEMTLGLSENVIRSFATDEISKLSDICDVAFSKGECASLFGDDSGASGGKAKRGDGCECSTGLDFCYMYANNDAICIKGDHSVCEYSSVGCGFAYSQYCNGYCA